MIEIGAGIKVLSHDLVSSHRKRRHVKIADGVTSIGDGAFYRCSSLTSITIPNSVKSIGDGAFGDCRSLTSITIPNSVKSIGDSAFSGCSRLTRITIPNSVTTIGDDAFYGCSSLTSIIIPNSVSTIGDDTFYGCSSLTSITIPNSVTTIGCCAFSNCSSLTRITIPNSVTSIGSSAFSGCSSLTSITIPNSVTRIGGFAFSGCSRLTSITIPNSVTTIGCCAFSNCSSLTSITIPNSVTTIGDYAFYGCSSLTRITIPNSVTTIGDDAFSGCKNLEVIYIDDIDGHLERIKRLIPIHLHEKIRGVDFSVLNDAKKIQDEVMERCLNRSNLLNAVISPTVLPREINDLLLDYIGPSEELPADCVGPYFSTIKSKIFSEPWPEDRDAIDEYRDRLMFIVNLFEFNGLNLEMDYKKRDWLKFEKTLSAMASFKDMVRSVSPPDNPLKAKISETLGLMQRNIYDFVEPTKSNEREKIKESFSNHLKIIKPLLYQAYPVGWRSILLTILLMASLVGIIPVAMHYLNTGSLFFRPPSSQFNVRFESLNALEVLVRA